MTDGYESFWNVGVSEYSDKPSIQEAFSNKEKVMKTAKHY